MSVEAVTSSSPPISRRFERTACEWWAWCTRLHSFPFHVDVHDLNCPDLQALHAPCTPDAALASFQNSAFGSTRRHLEHSECESDCTLRRFVTPERATLRRSKDVIRAEVRTSSILRECLKSFLVLQEYSDGREACQIDTARHCECIRTT
jgi:hypothetical protein